MFGSLRPPFFELLQARLNGRQSFLHLQPCIAKRLDPIDIEGSFHHRGIVLEDVELFLFFLFFLLLSFSESFVQIVTIFVCVLLHTDAHIGLHPMIRVMAVPTARRR